MDRRDYHNQLMYGEKMWQQALKEWDYICAKCKRQFPANELTKGHVVPRRPYGGQKRRGNLVPLCGACNQSDGNMLVSHYHRNRHGNHLTNDEQANRELACLSAQTGNPIRLRSSVETTFRIFGPEPPVSDNEQAETHAEQSSASENPAPEHHPY